MHLGCGFDSWTTDHLCLIVSAEPTAGTILLSACSSEEECRPWKLEVGMAEFPTQTILHMKFTGVNTCLSNRFRRVRSRHVRHHWSCSSTGQSVGLRSRRLGVRISPGPPNYAILIRAVSQRIGGGPRKWQIPQGRENRAWPCAGFGAQRYGNMRCWK